MDFQFRKQERRKRKISNSSSEHQLDPASKQRVQSSFEKKFAYKKNSNWRLTSEISHMTLKWEQHDLINLKIELNSLKDKLSDKDIVKWHKHTTYMNIAGNVINELRQCVRPELCTQAWCKFYEIVSTFDLIDVNAGCFNSVHLCEAPGAFITSLNHFLVSAGYSGEWNWLGTTLNPYYEGNSPTEMIDDDRFVSGSYGNWDFGVDNTGNLMSWQNIEQLRKKAAELGPVHLVTADGSIDCQDNPAEQERVVSKLHYCEALTSVLILSPGGSLVLKKFTMFECETICLMYLMNCLFRQVNVFKPATSKSGNSEVYWVCQGFLGLEDKVQQLEQLCQCCCNVLDPSLQDGCLFAEAEIPEDFLEQHIQCCRVFTSQQEETIQRNLDLYDKLSDDNIELIDAMRDYCSELYINKYNVRSIPGYMKITKAQRASQRPSSNHKHKEAKRNQGTYHQRVQTKALQWEQRVLQFLTYDVDHSQIQWFQNASPLQEDDLTGWICANGLPIDCIKSSRFCEESYIHQLQEILIKWKEDCFDKLWMSPIISALQLLFDQSVYDFPCNVNIISSKEVELEEIERLEFVNKVTIIDDFTSMETSVNTVLVIPDIYLVNKEIDVTSQRNLVQTLVNMFKVLSRDVTVVIQMTTALTRFTAGILYILSSCFIKIGLLPQPGRESLMQTLICYKYTGLPHFLLEHCCHLLNRTSSTVASDFILLESVPVLTLTSNYGFVDFLTTSNEVLLKSFITSVITKVKTGWPNQT